MLRLASTLLLTLALAFGLAACGEDDEPAGGQAQTEAPERTPPPADAAGGKSDVGCETVQEPEGKPSPNLPRPRERLDPSRTYVARVLTSCGAFEITLDAKRAPKTGGSFLSLAERGFYDGTIFHRVVAGFVIQGGDPEGTGIGGPGYSVREAPPETLTYEKGTAAMAKAGDEPPGTSGSQFFVMTETQELPPEYALLGKVTRGMDVVERIGAVEVGGEDRPVDPVVIRQVTVATR